MPFKDDRVPAEHSLKGRDQAIDTAKDHFVNAMPLKGPWPEPYNVFYCGLGCFWGAERLFWTKPGVIVTAVGYGGGDTPNPSYEEVCSGKTGHTELVMVVYDPQKINLAQLLQTFWQQHDPTQGMRQGNDIGSNYRSALYLTRPEDLKLAQDSRAQYQSALDQKKLGQITTEIAMAGPFYYAESYHQQYLAKNPNGYCGLQGTGVSCPIAAQ